MKRKKNKMPPLNAVMDMPSRHISNLPFVVVVYDLKTDATVREDNLNYGSKEDRQLLGRITIWALQNGCGMEVMNKSDYDKQPKE